MNPNWPFWIASSITTHFKALASGTFLMRLEGEAPRKAGEAKHPIFEIRIDGPWFTQRMKNDWDAYVEVNILVQAPIARLTGTYNVYTIHSLAGAIAARFTDIALWSYGEVTPAQVGCLSLLQSGDRRESIKINHFGQIEPAVEILQATVEGHYTTQLRSS